MGTVHGWSESRTSFNYHSLSSFMISLCLVNFYIYSKAIQSLFIITCAYFKEIISISMDVINYGLTNH
jgi:hypothetical protein